MSLTVPKEGNIKFALSGDAPFVARVTPGEVFRVECVINIGDGVLNAPGEPFDPALVRIPFVNGATGPMEIAGAKPGDMLTVEIIDMALEEIGFTALWPGIGMFPDWVRQKEFGFQPRVMAVKDGFVHWSETVRLPVRPMIGVMGVAPVLGAVPTVDNGPNGGNLDVQELCPGSRVMFRVNADGAHFFAGDCHAIQGDGEANGMGATEVGATLTLRVSLSPAPERLRWPRLETASHIGTIGCARPLEDAMRIAFEEMVYWLEDDWGIPAAEAYMLLGQIAEARCTQVVNPKYTYVCKVAKEILAAFR
jgi:acetamidase/formamidase